MSGPNSPRSPSRPVWTQQEALDLCASVEEIAPDFGAHVALTGGLLYKEGKRKDVDILFYSIRQVEAIDIQGLLGSLKKIGFASVTGPHYNWLYKAKFANKPVDMFFPEQPKPDSWLDT